MMFQVVRYTVLLSLGAARERPLRTVRRRS
jgi:hypothetical protein